MTSSTTKYVRLKAKKPVGGYILLTVQQLCLFWWLYRTRAIQLLDFRVWFAAHEMVARRCQIAPGQVPEYTQRELYTLVGGRGGDRLRASLRRLDYLGLLTCSPHTLTFATSSDDVRHIEDFSGCAQMFDKVPNHHRRVPVPRQAIRLIAGGGRPAVIATILGTCFRCLYYHAREKKPVESGGWCKCSWLAPDVPGPATHHEPLGNLHPGEPHLGARNSARGPCRSHTLPSRHIHTRIATPSGVVHTPIATPNPCRNSYTRNSLCRPIPPSPPNLPPPQRTCLRRTEKNWCSQRHRGKEAYRSSLHASAPRPRGFAQHPEVAGPL